MEVDHILICSPNRANIADALVNAGFAEGSGNSHPGQGTANRRFFFNNAYLEFLYLEESLELTPADRDKLDIRRRFNRADHGRSPFGVGFRPSELNENAPFPHWVYKPSYLPDGYSINVGDASTNEPLWFFLDFVCRPDRLPSAKQQPLNHPCGVATLTSVRLSVSKGTALSPATQRIIESGAVAVNFDTRHSLEMTFDHRRQNKRLSLLPDASVTIYY
ncbi:VOC family protein [Brenneria populi]|uniref:VOC family protein n=1 Tax=Brenneria populi TaxID=1505588 RepID=A0ABU6JME9_9GAMM|nr:VOC family protein [Brenneria populi Li et al. 2015]